MAQNFNHFSIHSCYTFQNKLKPEPCQTNLGAHFWGLQFPGLGTPPTRENALTHLKLWHFFWPIDLYYGGFVSRDETARQAAAPQTVEGHPPPHPTKQPARPSAGVSPPPTSPLSGHATIRANEPRAWATPDTRIEGSGRAAEGGIPWPQPTDPLSKPPPPGSQASHRC